MIHFTPFRTPRMTIQLKELTIGKSMALCARPAAQHEAATTALLEYVIEKPERQHPGQVIDPRLMTVQERGMLAGHYLAHTVGNPNFSIGGEATFSQYLYTDVQTACEIEIGEVCEDQWLVAPLMGYQAESIERLFNAGKLPQNYRGWMLGAMACQMRRVSEPELEDIPDALFDKWLSERLEVIDAFPESDFSQLLAAYLSANDRLQHLLRMAFADDGFVFVSEVPGLPSARFPVSDMFSDATARFLGVTTGHAD